MTAIQFVNKIETHWKELNSEVRPDYIRMCSRFTDEQRDRIFDLLLSGTTGNRKHSRYLPKLSEIYEAADTLLIGLESRKKERSRGCEKCRYSTWIIVTLSHPLTGEPYEAAKPCSCTPRKLTRPAHNSTEGNRVWDLFHGEGRQDQGNQEPDDRIPF